jgi:hypothetical protein
MYDDYRLLLKNNETISIEQLHFKSDNKYCSILEHVSKHHGELYLKLILQEFSCITLEKISGFCVLNDTFGKPVQYYFNEININCSPTSLRYIYHSLLILKHIETTKCSNIVEVGCGYGGLCLAINYFMSNFSVKITTYNIVDLSEPLILIEKYLLLHKENISIQLAFHDSLTYGRNIIDEDMFFVSNYCYTEIDVEHNKNYTDLLLSKVKHGFITWQNGGNKGSYPVSNASNILKHDIIKTEEERPQTDAGYDIYKNYFVYF